MPTTEEKMHYEKMQALAEAAAILIARGVELIGVDAVFMVILAENNTGKVHISTDVDASKAAEFAHWAVEDMPFVTDSSGVSPSSPGH
jgi:hypothetical protein